MPAAGKSRGPSSSTSYTAGWELLLNLWIFIRAAVAALCRVHGRQRQQQVEDIADECRGGNSPILEGDPHVHMLTNIMTHA
jgi:hypothetical protein